MASRFWVGGTGIWAASGSSTGNHWATSTGGVGADANAPVTGDSATFDGSSGGGTVTVAASVSGLSLASITCGAFTGTLDFATNQPINLTFTAGTGLSVTGAGARTLNFGTGTLTFSSAAGSQNFLDATTVTGLTNPTTAFSSSTIVVSSSGAGQQQFVGGGLTFGTLTINSRTNGMTAFMGGANTFFAINVTGPCDLEFPQGVTQTITGSITITGTSAGLVLFKANSINSSQVATLAVTGATLSATWAAFKQITLSGASLSATSSFDLGANTGISVSAPAGGGGGGGGVIGS
jgi:hypothetical protein